jgi:hypothetical protein
MTKRNLRILAAACVAAFSLSAAPASAWYSIVFFDANGQQVGSQLYCDNGAVQYYDGIQTDNYQIFYHTGELPC